MQIIKTVGIDGHQWMKMPEGQKYGYVAGYVVGFAAGRFEASTPPSLSQSPGEWLFSVLSVTKDFERLIKEIDEFYSIIANRGIYLLFALPIVIESIKAIVSDDKYQEWLENARKKSLRVRSKI